MQHMLSTFFRSSHGGHIVHRLSKYSTQIESILTQSVYYIYSISVLYGHHSRF